MAAQDLLQALLASAVSSLCFAIVVVIGSCARCRAAFLCGDRNAWGPDSLKPTTYVHWFGTFALPALLAGFGSPVVIGFSKPVRIDYAALPDTDRGTVLVSLASPAACFGVALAATLILLAGGGVTDPTATWMDFALAQLVVTGVWLGIFVLLPLPGLDGGRIAAILFPNTLGPVLKALWPQARLILLALICIPPGLGRLLDAPLDVLGWIMNAMAMPIALGLMDLAR